MSGGSQHNPNGRQSQLGPGWSPLQVANLLARAPQAHMASERGVTWHTPTPPPHLYHVPAPSPPDPLQALSQLQAMKTGNSVFRHTATPPEIYRHTPTPPEKHLMRHTPSPGDVKGAALPPTEIYPHLGPGRGSKPEKLRAEELLAYARGGVDLSLGGPRGANGSPAPPAPAAAGPALSVRDAPTINSLIARAAPHARPAHARVDALLERLAAAPAPPPAPASPHSVIVHSRAAPTPSPPSSNEDSADSCGAPPGSKRKRKPERTIRVPAPPPPAAAPSPPPPREPTPVENGDVAHPLPAPPPAPHPAAEPPAAPAAPAAPPPAVSASLASETPVEPRAVNGPPRAPSPRSPPAPEPHVRRKTRSNSAETIDDIAAMIASREPVGEPPAAPAAPEPELVTVDKLKSVLASPEPAPRSPPAAPAPPPPEPQPEPPAEPPAAAPKRRSARTSNAESTNVPVESPSEGKPAEPEAAEAAAASAEPTAASFVEVENQLEKMFAGLEEERAEGADGAEGAEAGGGKAAKPRNRRKSVPSKDTPKKPAKRARRALTLAADEPPRKKSPPRRKAVKKKSAAERGKKSKEPPVKDAYDSGSNASSSKSRGPYIQIVGPRASPVSVSVVNAGAEEARGEEWRAGGGSGGRNGLRARGLHASTLGLRYDATTPDATWLCAFCDAGPHHQGRGDLFGPYAAEIDCDEYRALDEASRRRFEVRGGAAEVWTHEACAVWAPGLVAAGARLWGLAAAVWSARGTRCALCGRPGASVSCAMRACRSRVHLPCGERARWALLPDYRALCPRHRHA